MIQILTIFSVGLIVGVALGILLISVITNDTNTQKTRLDSESE
jgi:uncharacterized membrane-anchored protein YhcB (DUF1043 family)